MNDQTRLTSSLKKRFLEFITILGEYELRGFDLERPEGMNQYIFTECLEDISSEIHNYYLERKQDIHAGASFVLL